MIVSDQMRVVPPTSPNEVQIALKSKNSKLPIWQLDSHDGCLPGLNFTHSMDHFRRSFHRLNESFTSLRLNPRSEEGEKLWTLCYWVDRVLLRTYQFASHSRQESKITFKTWRIRNSSAEGDENSSDVPSIYPARTSSGRGKQPLFSE